MRKSSGTRISRRGALRLAAAGGTVLAAGPAIISGRSAHAQGVEDELVFASNGGAYQKVIENEIFPAFAKNSGVKKLTFVAGQPADNLAKLRVQKGNPSIDAIWLAGAITYKAADEGLLEAIDESSVPNVKILPPELRTEKFAVPAGISTMGILYNKEIFAQKGFAAPTSWWDLWDAKYKRHVATFSSNSTGQIAMLTIMAKALTGDWKKLDAAFAKMRELKPNVVDFFTSVGALDRAIQQREVWISLHAVQGAIQHVRAGEPIGFVHPKEGSPGYTAGAGIVKGAPHPRAARAWVNYLLSADAQTRLAAVMGYSPVRPDAKVPEKFAHLFPDLSKVFVPDWRYLTSQLPSIVERWNRIVEG
jgi:putative spermidine/putrescine transport system substrate-binding protein